MRATITSTDVITSIDGRPARVWKGETAGGVAFVAFVARVAVEEDADRGEFEAELVAVAPPREIPAADVLRAFSTRML